MNEGICKSIKLSERAIDKIETKILKIKKQ